jgi:hypothetical protein
MAKESIKARQRKREALVARYAEKRAALKAEGNYDALQRIPRNARSFAQSLQTHRPSKGLHPYFRHLP